MITKVSLRTFSNGIFSGLIFCAAYIQMFEFLNVNIEKRITSTGGVTIHYKLCLFNKLRDKNLSYLSKDKKDKKKFLYYSLHKACNK